MEHLQKSLIQSAPVQLPAASRSQHVAPYGLEPNTDENANLILDYWRILARNKKTIVLSCFLGLFLGVAIGIPFKTVYRAVTSLEVLSMNQDFMNMKQSSPTTTTDNGFDTSEEETQAKLLESPVLIDRVVSKLDPSPTPARPKIATTGWRGLLHLHEAVDETPREKLLDKAVNSLKVRPTSRTRVLEVSVDSTDPQLVLDFVDTLTQEFIAKSTEARLLQSKQMSTWLARELEDARSNLRKSEDALQAYARTSGLIFTDDTTTDSTTNIATEKLLQLQQNLSMASSDRIAKQATYELASTAPPDSLAEVLNDPTLQDTQSTLNVARQQVADLSTVFDPSYSKVRRAQASLDAVQASFDLQRSNILKRIKTDYEEAVRREKLLIGSYDAQTREVTSQDEKAIQYKILNRDVDSNRQLYDAMLQQMKQASISSALRASNVQVVDPASLLDKPVFPRPTLNGALGMLLGLFISVISIILRERADRTLQQPGDVKMWTDLAELGTIPASSVEGTRAHYYSPQIEREKAVRLPKKGALQGVELAMWKQKVSILAEAFRSALTSILFIGEHGSRPKVMVCTSANPAEGKTTVASNLAIGAAEIRMKVLIIDADLRRPRMHNIFGLDNTRGLSDYLQNASEESDVADWIKETSVKGLHVLPAGTATHAATHLLYSPRFASVLAEVRESFDMVIVDTPPMSQITDARVVARLSDAVILVARSGRTTRDALLAARDRFADDRISVLGAVLNDWNGKSVRGDYYGYGYRLGKRYNAAYSQLPSAVK